MNSKGFTLIELLGVIVIIALLTVLVLPNIVNSVKGSSTKTDDLTLKMIYSAADIYISNHESNYVKENGNKYEISLNDLIEEDLIKSPIKLSDADITNSKCIQVTYTDKFNYELKNTGECENYIWEICSLEEGTSKSVGAKYICELDQERIFYVLENDQNSNYISLIMDENYVDDYVPLALLWCNPKGDYPRDNACNHDNLDKYIDYIQNNIFKNNIIVNLPTLEQLQAVNKSNTLVKTPWLYDNLYNKVNVYGYWTLTPSSEDSSKAWTVSYLKNLRTVPVVSGYGGIRPVITISKSRLD